MKKILFLILLLGFSSYVYADTLVLLPNGIGTYNQLTPGSGDSSIHYENIDEYPTPDNSGTYNYNSAGSDQKDTYQFQNSAYLGVITNVATTIRWQVSTSGGAGYAVILTYGNIYYSSALSASGYGVWTTVTKNWATNPYTGAAWTWAEISALEVGTRGTTKICMFTQEYITITYTPGPDPGASSANAIFYGTDF